MNNNSKLIMKRKSIDNLADNLIVVFTQFHKHIIKIDNYRSEMGISRSHFELLFLLDDMGPLSMSKIGEKLLVSRPYITALVDKLARQGLVERHASNNDRRVVNIVLTESGKAYLEDHKKLLSQNIRGRLTNLSNEDIEELFASVNSMRTLLPKIEL